MKLGYKHLLPFAMAFFGHLQSALKNAENAEIKLDKDKLESFILLKINDWNPQINKKYILDDDSRINCAKLISSIAIKLLED